MVEERKMKFLKSGFSQIIGRGESGKAILNETLNYLYVLTTFSLLTACCLVRLNKQFFSGADAVNLSKYFSGKGGSPTYRNWPVRLCLQCCTMYTVHDIRK